MTALQVGDIASLNRCPFRKFFLGPASCIPKRLYVLRQQTQDLGFGNGQALIIPELQTRFCTIRGTSSRIWGYNPRRITFGPEDSVPKLTEACTGCGQTLPGASKFCNHCGAPVATSSGTPESTPAPPSEASTQRCRRCSAPVGEGILYCYDCRCRRCSAPVGEGVLYCNECGAKTASPSPPEGKIAPEPDPYFKAIVAILGVVGILAIVLVMMSIAGSKANTARMSVPEKQTKAEPEVSFDRMTPAQHLAKAKAVMATNDPLSLTTGQIEEASRHLKAIPASAPESAEAVAFEEQSLEAMNQRYLEKVRAKYANDVETLLRGKGFDIVVTENGDELILASDLFTDEANRVYFLGTVRALKNSKNFCAMGFRRVSLSSSGFFSGTHVYSLGCKAPKGKTAE